MTRTCPTPRLNALRYLVEYGPTQTSRVGQFVADGKTKRDRATTQARALLETLERRGMVHSEKRWAGGPLFWEATVAGRALIAELDA